MFFADLSCQPVKRNTIESLSAIPEIRFATLPNFADFYVTLGINILPFLIQKSLLTCRL